MEFTASQQRLTWFRDLYNKGSLELKPPFQRKPVWSAKQKNFLIESILLGLPIPEIYLQIEVHDEDSKYFVVDGQQRIRAVLQFMGVEKTAGEEEWNKFALDKLDAMSKYRGATYTTLDKEGKDALLNYALSVRELKAATDADVRDIFKRFNKYVTKLNDQEIRQATYAGPFMVMSWKLADDDFWVKAKLVTPAQIRRMKDVEFVSELIIGTLHGPQGGSARLIDEYYTQYEDSEDQFPSQGVAEKRFNRVLDIMKALFAGRDDDNRFGANRSDFYTLFVACAQSLIDHTFVDSEVSKLRTTLEKFSVSVDKRLADEDSAADDDVVKYVRAVEKGANDKKRRTDRHAVLIAKIKKHFKSAK